MARDHESAVLHMGFLLGTFSRKEVMPALVQAIQEGHLSREYVEALRDKLNAILVASNTGTPPSKKPPANIEDDDGCPN